MKLRILLCTFLVLMFSKAYSQQKDICSLFTLDQEARLGVLGFQKKSESTFAPDYLEPLQAKFYTCKYTWDSKAEGISTRQFVFVSESLNEAKQAAAQNLILQYQKELFAKPPSKSEFQKIETGFCFVTALVDRIVASTCKGIAHQRALAVIRVHELEPRENLVTMLSQTKALFDSVSSRLE